ncbi:orotidine 5'-phosphate decarboxylase / HUMPS family protein, partial [Nocardia carnea]
LAATSNPEAARVQQAVVDGRTLAQTVVDAAAETNRGSEPGSVGVVVGATLTDIPDLGALNGPILLPGVGAQGGTAAAVRALLPESLWPAAVPNVSRDVLGAGPSVTALRDRLAAFQEEFAFLR